MPDVRIPPEVSVHHTGNFLMWSCDQWWTKKKIEPLWDTVRTSRVKFTGQEKCHQALLWTDCWRVANSQGEAFKDVASSIQTGPWSNETHMEWSHESCQW